MLTLGFWKLAYDHVWFRIRKEKKTMINGDANGWKLLEETSWLGLAHHRQH